MAAAVRPARPADAAPRLEYFGDLAVVVQRRSSMQSWWTRAVAIGALWLAATAPARATDAAAHHPLLGAPAPELVERVLSGPSRNFRLSEHRGDVVVVGFWTSWCGSCRAYLERLAKLNATYASAGLVVVGISLDDKADAARAEVRAIGPQFATAVDTGKVFGKRISVADVPLTLLIDRAGVVRFAHGELDSATDAALVVELRRLLDE